MECNLETSSFGEDKAEGSSNKLFENNMVLEIFAGTANLTQAIRQVNLRGVAVDKTTSRTKHQILVLDLTLEDDIIFLENFIRQEANNLRLIHFAPPCGTGSAARKRKLPADVEAALIAAGHQPPKPLRDARYPDGYPWLKGLDLHKIQQANALYSATERLATLAISLNIRVSIENPTNSLFWLTSPIQRLLQRHPGFHNKFHNCMMGGKRDKQTTWWCNDRFFGSFNLPCSGDHQHSPWRPSLTTSGVNFPTSEEAEYPQLLCQRIASLVVEELRSLGSVDLSDLPQQVRHRRTTAVNSLVMGFLPRGQKLRPLVSDFGDYKKFALKPFQNASEILATIPAGARITTRKLVSWGELRLFGKEISFEFLDTSQLVDEYMTEVITVGIPREPKDFVLAAVKAGHPRFLPYSGNTAVDDLLSHNLWPDFYETERHRIAFFKRWVARADELKVAEEKFKSELPVHARRVLEGKRLLLMKEILEDLNFPDKHLIDDMAYGFKLTGWMRDSQIFIHLPRPPKISFASLLRTSQGLQKAILKRAKAADDGELHLAAWRETCNELDNGWIWRDESGDLKDKVIAHRFGLRQGEKVRVIDNFKEGGLNDACGLPEKFVLHGVDYIASTVVRALALSSPFGFVKLTGKTFDLTAAYKQYPIHADDREHLRIALKNPDSSDDSPADLFGLNALPFGATGSVAGFLRVSAALFFILTAGLKIWTSSFFDDFPTLSVQGYSSSADSSVRLLFDLLGVGYAKEGKKNTQFDERMKALGIVFDFSNSGSGVVLICHTPERRAELLEKIRCILSEDSLPPKAAESLKGRIQWYDSFLFGRVANLAIHRLGKRAYSKVNSVKLDRELRSSLEFLLNRIEISRPLEISAHTERPLLMFTDGAVEPGESNSKVGSVGGVLYDEDGKATHFFSEVVPDILMNIFLKEAENPIYLVELLAVYIGLILWGGTHPGRYVVAYIDNEASRSALVKAYSSTELGNVLVKLFVKQEDDVQWKTWFGRVCSFSNPADAPSRGDTSLLETEGAERTLVAWDLLILSVESELHSVVG